VKIVTVGRKRRQPAPTATAHRPRGSRGHKQVTHCGQRDRSQSVALFDAGELDAATLYFSEFKSVITQKPTALQLIPAKIPRAALQRPAPRPPTRPARRERDPRRAVAAQPATQVYRSLLENAA
jgi:F-type H+-transporting ATPase subunit gamma